MGIRGKAHTTLATSWTDETSVTTVTAGDEKWMPFCGNSSTRRTTRRSTCPIDLQSEVEAAAGRSVPVVVVLGAPCATPLAPLAAAINATVRQAITRQALMIFMAPRSIELASSRSRRSSQPELLPKPGGPGHRASHRGARCLLGGAQGDLLLGTRPRRVEELPGQYRRRRPGERHDHPLELRSLALVDRRRPPGVYLPRRGHSERAGSPARVGHGGARPRGR